MILKQILFYLFVYWSLCVKNEIFVHHITVGGDTNRGALPWPVSPPATFCSLTPTPLRWRGTRSGRHIMNYWIIDYWKL